MATSRFAEMTDEKINCFKENASFSNNYLCNYTKTIIYRYSSRLPQIIVLLFHSYAIFWLLPGLTENRIDGIIRLVRMTKTTQTKPWKCPLFVWVNEIRSDENLNSRALHRVENSFFS